MRWPFWPRLLEYADTEGHTMRKVGSLKIEVQFTMLPRWLQRFWVYLFSGASAEAADRDAGDDGRDEFGRVLFAMPGYGTC